MSTDPAPTTNPAATTGPDTNPTLRHRLPLYPSQFLVAMAIVSIGPLLHPMMRDLGVPLSRGGLVSAGLFIGNASAIVILNTALARFPAKNDPSQRHPHPGGSAGRGRGRFPGSVVAVRRLPVRRVRRGAHEHHLLDMDLRAHGPQPGGGGPADDPVLRARDDGGPADPRGRAGRGRFLALDTRGRGRAGARVGADRRRSCRCWTCADARTSGSRSSGR